MKRATAKTLLMYRERFLGRYEVDKRGHVIGTVHGSPHELQQRHFSESNPERYVDLYDREHKRYIRAYVSDLVAAWYLPPKPRGRYALGYRDGNMSRCHADNLYWKPEGRPGPRVARDTMPPVLREFQTLQAFSNALTNAMGPAAPLAPIQQTRIPNGKGHWARRPVKK